MPLLQVLELGCSQGVNSIQPVKTILEVFASRAQVSVLMPCFASRRQGPTPPPAFVLRRMTYPVLRRPLTLMLVASLRLRLSSSSQTLRHGGKLEVLVAHDDLPNNDFEELLQMVTDPATTYVPQVRHSPGTGHVHLSCLVPESTLYKQSGCTANLPPSGPCQPPGRVPHVHRPQLL